MTRRPPPTLAATLRAARSLSRPTPCRSRRPKAAEREMPSPGRTSPVPDPSACPAASRCSAPIRLDQCVRLPGHLDPSAEYLRDDRKRRQVYVASCSHCQGRSTLERACVDGHLEVLNLRSAHRLGRGGLSVQLGRGCARRPCGRERSLGGG